MKVCLITTGCGWASLRVVVERHEALFFHWLSGSLRWFVINLNLKISQTKMCDSQFLRTIWAVVRLVKVSINWKRSGNVCLWRQRLPLGQNLAPLRLKKNCWQSIQQMTPCLERRKGLVTVCGIYALVSYLIILGFWVLSTDVRISSWLCSAR